MLVYICSVHTSVQELNKFTVTSFRHNKYFTVVCSQRTLAVRASNLQRLHLSLDPEKVSFSRPADLELALLFSYFGGKASRMRLMLYGNQATVTEIDFCDAANEMLIGNVWNLSQLINE